MEKVKIGLIGVGNMGSAVADMIGLKGDCPELELAAICDSNPDRIEWAKERFKDLDVKLFDNAEDMFKAKVVDAVYIGTPHYDHPVLAMQAFDYGLHVISEKPAGVYTKNVREMNEKAKKAGVTFGVMFQTRTTPSFRKAKEIINSGEFGAIRGVTWIANNWYRSQFYYDSGSWRATWAGEGGGVLLNQCPHNLDILQWLCGMPIKITATCKVAQWHDIEVEDDVVATLEYANGAMGAFIASTGVTPGSNRLEIAMDKGTIVIENYGDLTVHELCEKEQDYSKKIKDSFDTPKMSHIKYDFSNYKGTGGHKEVLNAFAGNILRGTPLIANGEEGINSLMLSNAMYLSDWIKAPVSLPIDEDLFLEELNKRRATSKLKDVKAVFADTTNSYRGVSTK